jgi:DNA-binding GntR family transcriptional regulator
MNSLPKKAATGSIKRTTLSEMAHQAIRRDIITGGLAPGFKLVVAALAETLGLSATPINEALAALEREGLVVYAPHRGYFVRTVERENIAGIYSVREAFELLAVRNAAKTADQKLIQQLKKILRQGRLSLRATDTTQFSDLDLVFHRLIWGSLDNSLATRIGELIEVQIRLLVATTARAPGRIRGALEEHEEILQAIKNGDPARAESMMKRHIRNARAALERALLEKTGAKCADATAPESKSPSRQTPAQVKLKYAEIVPNRKT